MSQRQYHNETVQGMQVEKKCKVLISTLGSMEEPLHFIAGTEHDRSAKKAREQLVAHLNGILQI